MLRLLLAAFTLALATAAHAGTPQAITFPPIQDFVTTDGGASLAATASSGLVVTYSITSPAGVATLSGANILISGTAGTVTVKASQTGNATYDPAPDAYRSFIVGTASQKFAKLATNAHGHHEAVIKPDGTLWIWGENQYGQFGDGVQYGWRNVPGKVGTATTWASVSCGFYHTAALRADGSLYTAGRNTNGQLGAGSTTDRPTLTKVGTSTWLAVSCGENHTIALRSDGTLWACGDNQYGQLGDTTTTQRTSLVQIGSVTTWTAVSCGFNHTLALRSDGTLWAWGRNIYGELGDGTYTQRNSPVQIGTATTWASISAGAYHSLALRSNGTLWGWGNNGSGQLASDNVANPSSNVPLQAPGPATWASVSATDFHSTGRRTDGTLWVWGDNRGQLGTATPLFSFTPLQVPFAVGAGTAILARVASTTVLQGNGTLQGLGTHQGLVWGLESRPSQIGGIDVPAAWKQIACGTQYQVAISAEGTLWTAGLGTSLQLGNGAVYNTQRLFKISEATNWTQASANEFHAAAVRSDGTLWAWGSNASGKLGDGTTTDRDVPTQVPGTTWTHVACGNSHTAALRSDGTLWAWGENSDGQVGDNTSNDRPSPVQVGSATGWAHVSCASNYTVAVRADGTLWAWGGNANGRLGDGTTTTRRTPVQIGTATTWHRVACGSTHTLALRTDGTLWAWGLNGQGVLGDGTTTTRSSPVQIGTDTNWASIAAGNEHSAATRQNGILWSWGQNTYNQLGDDSYTTQVAPVQSDTATNWTAAACQIFGTLGLRSDGTLWGFGLTFGSTPVLLNPFEPNSIWPPRASQTLTFPALSGPLTQGQSVALAATATSGLPITYTVVGPATLSGNVLTPTGPGAITIAAYQHGSPAWYVAESRMQTITALSVQHSWRQTHFGTTSNTGTAADTFDADHDGLANLVEYAFGLSPVVGASMQLPVPQREGNAFTVTFTEPAGSTGVNYGASYSPTLQGGSWTPIPDTGSGTTHIFSAPISGGDTKLFIQLSVTAAP